MDTDMDTMLRMCYGYALRLNFILFLNFISCLVSTLDTTTNCIVFEYRLLTHHYDKSVVSHEWSHFHILCFVKLWTCHMKD